MLETLAIILFVGWLVGAFALNLGWFIHILLIAAIVVIVIRMIRGNPVL